MCQLNRKDTSLFCCQGKQKLDDILKSGGFKTDYKMIATSLASRLRNLFL